MITAFRFSVGNPEPEGKISWGISKNTDNRQCAISRDQTKGKETQI
jgi:hypothetical protein